MEYLPSAAAKWLRGSIDPHSQHLVETYSQSFLLVLTIISFIASYLTSSVLLSLEIFATGLGVLLLASVPPWPFLQRHPIKFLKSRAGRPNLR